MGGHDKKGKVNYMQSRKHEIETIQCNRQTTHLGTNTIAKQSLFFQFDFQLAKTKLQYH